MKKVPQHGHPTMRSSSPIVQTKALKISDSSHESSNLEHDEGNFDHIFGIPRKF